MPATDKRQFISIDGNRIPLEQIIGYRKVRLEKEQLLL